MLHVLLTVVAVPNLCAELSRGCNVVAEESSTLPKSYVAWPASAWGTCSARDRPFREKVPAELLKCLKFVKYAFIELVFQRSARPACVSDGDTESLDSLPTIFFLPPWQ